MAENLSSLSIAIIDEFEGLLRRQEILRICREELDNPGDKTWLRAGLLIDSYLSETDCHFSQLSWYFQRLRAGLRELEEIASAALEQPPQNGNN